jgi:hypothetical protein
VLDGLDRRVGDRMRAGSRTRQPSTAGSPLNSLDRGAYRDPPAAEATSQGDPTARAGLSGSRRLCGALLARIEAFGYTPASHPQPRGPCGGSGSRSFSRASSLAQFTAAGQYDE